MWKLVMYRTHYPGPDPAGYCHFCLISGSVRILIWKKNSGYGSGRILIWKKVRVRPDSSLKKKSGSGSGRNIHSSWRCSRGLKMKFHLQLPAQARKANSFHWKVLTHLLSKIVAEKLQISWRTKHWTWNRQKIVKFI